jgi:hypothetical protein
MHFLPPYFAIVSWFLVTSFTNAFHATFSHKTNPFAVGRKTTCRHIAQVDEIPTMVEALLKRVEPSEAAASFWFYFLAGSGALGIGGSQIPKIKASYDELKNYAQSPVTQGGEDLVTPLGYPEAVKVRDIEKILGQLPSVETILQKGEKASYMAQKGYCERNGFVNALEGCNPLAANAVFEALSGGAGDLIAPDILSTKMDQLNSVEDFQSQLRAATLQKLSAYAVFAFLLGLILDLIIESGINAWLPDMY